MLTCQNCGIEIKLEGITSCPGCGTKITTTTVKPKKETPAKSGKNSTESIMLGKKKEDEWIVQEEHVEGGIQSKPTGFYTPAEHISETQSTEKKELDLGDYKPLDAKEEEVPMPKPKTRPKKGEDDLMIQNPIESLMEEKPTASDKPKMPDKPVSQEKSAPVIKPTPGEKISYTESTFGTNPKSSPKKTDSVDDETPLSGIPTAPEAISELLHKHGPILTDPAPFSRETHVLHGRGVAFLDKNKIRLTGGFKAYPGDVVKVGEQEFVLKNFKKNNLPLYIAAGAFVVFLVILMVALGSSPTKNAGGIVGVVLEKGSQALLPNATVRIDELGKKAVTDRLGFFQFEQIPPGSYTLEASLSGYSTTQDNTSVTKQKTSNLALVLIPASEEVYSRLNLGREQITPPVNMQVPTKIERTGSIKIQSNVSGVVVMLDNSMLGTGNKLYGNINPGDHTLRVTKENYQDWESKIDVKAGATQTYKISLNPLTIKTTKYTKPQTYEDYISQAKSDYDDGNYNKAISHYTGALSLKSNSGEALLGRANAYLKIQDKKKAINDFFAAGKVYQENNSHSKAIEAFSQLIDVSSSSPNAYYERGNCYLQTGQFEKAISDFEAAISQSPKFFLAYVKLGYAQYKAEKYEESVDSYNKARKLNANSKHVYIGLAKTYQAMGNKSGAKKNYEKFRELTTYVDREALKDDPEWKAVLNFIGVKEEL